MQLRHPVVTENPESLQQKTWAIVACFEEPLPLSACMHWAPSCRAEAEQILIIDNFKGSAPRNCAAATQQGEPRDCDRVLASLEGQVL